ncbi:hypothetical protein ABFA07_017187 [Porites harrisoni]
MARVDYLYFAGASCSGMSQTLDEGCTISDDCSTITCKMNFVEKPITFKLKINKCDEPVTVTASMNVPDLRVTWSHTYTSDDIIEVPGFTVSLPSIFSAGVYVQVQLKDNGDRLHLKVKLLAGGKVFGKGVYPVKVTVMEGDLPISTNDCGMFKWWYDLSDATKAAVIGGPLLVICILVIYCCCCRSRPANQGAVLVTPAVGPTAVMATSTNTTAHMRPLVNVA